MTVELDGHTIDGGVGDYGIDNSGGYDRVTVNNGAITTFEIGVWLDGAVGNRITKLELRSNTGDGIEVLSGSDDVKIDGDAITDNADDGIDIAGVTGAK